MKTYEDDEFERIAMEQRIREKRETLGIPFVTQEELQELLKEEDEVQTPRNT